MLYYFLFLVGIFSFSEAEIEADESTCGISASLQRYKVFNSNRIFGGENSNEGDFPWYIWMYAGDGGCSGSIINEKWILTAAHCVNATDHVTRAVLILVYYGSVNWEIMGKQKIEALQYFVHPKYNVAYDNDVALIELSEPLKFSEYIKPVCLDNTVDPYPNEILTQCGMGSDFKQFCKLWGERDHLLSVNDKFDRLIIVIVKEEYSHFSHDILQDAPIQHINSSICQRDKSRICLGGVNHSSLPGDSGGPLMAIRDNQWIQIGICSTGSEKKFEDESISGHFLDYYMRVSYYCEWIKETTNNEVIC